MSSRRSLPGGCDGRRRDWFLVLPSPSLGLGGLGRVLDPYVFASCHGRQQTNFPRASSGLPTIVFVIGSILRESECLHGRRRGPADGVEVRGGGVIGDLDEETRGVLEVLDDCMKVGWEIGGAISQLIVDDIVVLGGEEEGGEASGGLCGVPGGVLASWEELVLAVERHVGGVGNAVPSPIHASLYTF